MANTLSLTKVSSMWIRILAERCNCIASSAIGIRWRPSVCLSSVTRVYCDKISEASIVLTKRLRLKSRGFRYKVALYLSYLHIKFDDEIKGKPLEFQAYVPIRLCQS